MKHQDIRRAITRGSLAGGSTAGLTGGFLAAATVYLNRFDPEHPILTSAYFFGVGFVFAVVPGVIIGALVSVAMFYLIRRKQPLWDSAHVAADVPPQNVWPPPPVTEKLVEDDTAIQ